MALNAYKHMNQMESLPFQQRRQTPNGERRTANSERRTSSNPPPILQPTLGRQDGRLRQTVTGVFEKSGHIGS
jgi:hypothetical protein